MSKPSFNTIGDWIYWCYANLGMAQAAIEAGRKEYGRVDFSIRNKLFTGFSKGSMCIHSLFEDEKWKINNSTCSYCGTSEFLSVDHLIPRKYGGSDSGDNLVPACKKCNSSKGDKDLLVWYFGRNEFPPLFVLRRYVKLAYLDFSSKELLSKPLAELSQYCNLYRIDLLPTSFPQPDELRL